MLPVVPSIRISLQYAKTAFSHQISVHQQVAITSCYSQIYHYVNICNIANDAMVQQK
jgi:hypothetical protein